MFTKKTLVSAIALAAAVYLPSASAVVHSDSFTLLGSVGGTNNYFSNVFDSSLTSAATELNNLGPNSTTGYNIDYTFNYDLPSSTASAAIVDLELAFAAGVWSKVDVKVSVDGATPVDLGHGHYFSSQDNMPSSLDFFTVAHSFSFEAIGTIYQPLGSQSTDIKITEVPNVPLLPVPEADQWAMLLLGLPMISWMVRRKQAA